MYSDKQHNQRSNWSLENNFLNTIKVKRKYTFYHFYDFTFQDKIKNYLFHSRTWVNTTSDQWLMVYCTTSLFSQTKPKCRLWKTKYKYSSLIFLEEFWSTHLYIDASLCLYAAFLTSGIPVTLRSFFLGIALTLTWMLQTCKMPKH